MKQQYNEVKVRTFESLKYWQYHFNKEICLHYKVSPKKKKEKLSVINDAYRFDNISYGTVCKASLYLINWS